MAVVDSDASDFDDIDDRDDDDCDFERDDGDFGTCFRLSFDRSNGNFLCAALEDFDDRGATTAADVVVDRNAT